MTDESQTGAQTAQTDTAELPNQEDNRQESWRGEKCSPSDRWREWENFRSEKRAEKCERRRQHLEEFKNWTHADEEPFHRPSDPLGALVWASILVWAGVILLANNLGWLEVWLESLSSLGLGALDFSLGVLSIVFLGMALILLGEVALRLLVPAFHRPVLGTLILAVVLLGVGLDGVIAWNLVLPVLLILIGVYIILGGSLPRRS